VKLGSGDTITLTEFKVAGAKEGMAQAVALQKVAINSKIVAAGDQYGDIAEGNAAEYLKFLPGVGVDYNANDARAITLRGLSTGFTNVTEDGNPMASASSGNLTRRFEFEQVAINNVSAVEVVKTLTPEYPASSTGGIVNFITKSGFDHEGSELTYRVYFQGMNDDLTLNKTEGWGQEKTRKILPGLYTDAFCFRFLTSLPIDERRLDFERLRNYGCENEPDGRMHGVVRFNGHALHLGAGAVANFECCRNLAGATGRDRFLLRLRGGATARCVHGLDAHRCVAGVFVFEMADRFLVTNGGMQLDLSLLPFQFGARHDAEQDRQCECDDRDFHGDNGTRKPAIFHF